MRKTNFDKSYERYLQYFEEDRKRGVPTKEPLSRSKYESFYKMQVNNNWATVNERKNMPRAIYRETGRINKHGTVNAARNTLLDAKKGLRMFQKVNVPILGVVENMSIFVCPECGHAEHIFGEGGAKRLSETYHVDVLGQLPLDAKIREEADSGAPTVVSSPESMAGKIYREIALKAAAAIAKTAKDMSLKMPSVRVENN